MPIVTTAAKCALISVALANSAGLVNLVGNKEPVPSLDTLIEVNSCAFTVAPLVIGLGREIIDDTAIEAMFPKRPQDGPFERTSEDLNEIAQVPSKLSYNHMQHACRKGLNTIGLSYGEQPVKPKLARDEDAIAHDEI